MNSKDLAMSGFFQAGKADTDFEVQETYVTGVCTLYPDRLAGPQEYAIRERSIVERAGKPLSVCAQEAKDLAFQSAVRRMEDLVSDPQPVDAPTPAALKAPRDEEPAPEPKAPPQSDQSSPAPEKTVVPVAQEPVPEPLERSVSAPASPPHRLELGDLRPASSLLAAAPEPEPDSEDQRIEKARAMKISCLGRLHECDGWTAGRLLDERPEVIVDMAKRYNVSKIEEKEALRTLYAEALRRVERAA